jgi:hypothetical protein
MADRFWWTNVTYAPIDRQPLSFVAPGSIVVGSFFAKGFFPRHTRKRGHVGPRDTRPSKVPWCEITADQTCVSRGTTALILWQSLAPDHRDTPLWPHR